MTETVKIQYLAAVSLLSVFIINILTPPEFVIDILYLCSIVLVFRQNIRTILYFSLTACVLIIINALFFDGEIKGSTSLWINRGISLVAIFITSYIAIHYRRQTQASTLKEQRYLKALEAMLFMTSHEVRKPVANILGLIETMGPNKTDLEIIDVQELFIHLQSSAHELDDFVKALNTFIEQTEKEHNQG
jgi:signal transduction histidine kinase